jgi:DNA-binding response OmpR family regulator
VRSGIVGPINLHLMTILQKRILIVESQPSLLLALEFLMAQHGYQTSIARTGEEALDTIPDFHPDLLLLETVLPYRSGFEVCQIVRQRKEWQPVRILLLSVRGHEADKAKGLALGADAFITKPFSTDALVWTIADLLKGDG